MQIRTFVVLVVVLAAIALSTLTAIGPSSEPRDIFVAACFMIVGLLSQALSYRSASGAFGSIAFIPFLSLIILAPNWTSVGAIALSVTCVEIVARRRLIKAVFNAAQFVLASAFSALAYDALGGWSPLDAVVLGPRLWVPLAVCFVSFLLINRLCVAAAVAVSERSDAWSVWRKMTDGSVLYDLLSVPFAYGYARVYSDLGPGWVLALSVPLLGVRQLYRMNYQLRQSSEELLQLMVKAIEARDPYTSGHSRRVSEYATIIARAVGLRQKAVQRITTAALLHDVGKIYEDFAPILRKPTALTPEERVVMESHSERGAQLVATVSQLEDLVPVIRHHHERWDGTGYPSRIAGEAIPIGARVIMLADTIDAMTSDRPYRAALGKEVVMAELRRVASRQFDPDLVDGFLSSPLSQSLFDAVDRYQGRPTEEREFRRKSGSGRLRIA